MAKRIGGLRRKSRGKFMLSPRERGKISLSKFFQELKEGDRIRLQANTAYQKGLYMPRFHGRTGILTGKRGMCYEVRIRDRDKQKTIVVHPLHLSRA